MGKAIAIVNDDGEAKTADKACIHINPETLAEDGFTNSAKLQQATQVSTSVFVNGLAVILKRSVIPTSDVCPKNWKGKVTGEFGGLPCWMDTSSKTVFVEGSEVVRQDDITKNEVIVKKVNDVDTCFVNAPGYITKGSDNVFAG